MLGGCKLKEATSERFVAKWKAGWITLLKDGKSDSSKPIRACESKTRGQT